MHVVPMAHHAAPPPPSGLRKRYREAWERLWASEISGAIDTAHLLPLAHLFELYDEADREWRAYKKTRLVPGSKGQPVLNPLFGALETLWKEISLLESRFGLTPEAKAKLGLHYAIAQASIDNLNRIDDGEDEDFQLTTAQDEGAGAP